MPKKSLRCRVAVLGHGQEKEKTGTSGHRTSGHQGGRAEQSGHRRTPDTESWAGENGSGSGSGSGSIGHCSTVQSGRWREPSESWDSRSYVSFFVFFVMPPFPSFSLCVCPENTLLRPFLRAEIRTSDRKGRACLALFQDVPRPSKSRVQCLQSAFYFWNVSDARHLPGASVSTPLLRPILRPLLAPLL